MLFNSLEFLVFAALFFAAWPAIRCHRRRRWVALTLLSLFFYGWWDPRFLPLVIGSGLLDFWAGKRMREDPSRSKRYLWISLVGNLGSLGLFKYLGFLTSSVHTVGALLGIETPILQLPLPIGISFYTFQSMSYTIDIYRGHLEPTDDVWHFFAYLTMFPQLVAGPILRARDLLPQLEEVPPLPGEEARFEGTRWIVHGYFKKTVLADNLAPFVAQAYASVPGPASAAYWWVVMAMFGAQVYCDFSGYSDIARGLARWMGYEFPRNFDHPWSKVTIREFWAHWHMTLFSWFADYIFIPLGGSRGTRWATARNIFVVWLVSGFWHGANWTFVVWGILHGIYLIVERQTRYPERIQAIPRVGRLLSWCVTLVLINFSWTLFPSHSISDSVQMMGRLLDLTHWNAAALGQIHDRVWMALGILGLRELWMYAGMSRSRFARARFWEWLEPFLLYLMLLACVFLRGPGSAFIYFAF